jgi:hypothetical protein
MSEQEEKPEGLGDKICETVEQITSPFENANQAMTMGHGGHGEGFMPKGAEGALGLFGVINGVRQMAQAKDVRHGAGAAVETANGALGLAGLFSSASWIPGAGNVGAAAAFGIETANAGIDEVQKNGTFGQRRTADGFGLVNVDKEGHAVQENRDFVDVETDALNDYVKNRKADAGPLDDARGTMNAVFQGAGAGLTTIGAGLWSKLKSVGHTIADPNGLGAMQEAMKEKENHEKALEADQHHAEQITEYRNASPEEKQAMEQVDALTNFTGMFGDERPSLKEEAQRQEGVENAAVGGNVVASAGNMLVKAMQMPEGTPGREEMIQAAQSIQQTGLSRMKMDPAAKPAESPTCEMPTAAPQVCENPEAS